MKVFFADDRQEEFVGTDGEESFGYIFRDRARIVVVFYRRDWGTTPFTRAEEAAIKQRAWQEGYGFSVWVPMDETKEVPPYLPPQYIWFDFDRYGVEGLAAVVEERVRKSGAEIRPSSPLDELRRLRRLREAERRKREFISSKDSVEYFEKDVERILKLVERQAKVLSELDPELRFKVEPDHVNCGAVMSILGYQASITYYQKYSNMVKGSDLTWQRVHFK